MNDLAARVDRQAARVESIALAIVGRVASWVSPIPVAVMTARAIARIFDLGTFWAGVTSVALELVGMTTSSLWLDLRDYNDTKRKDDPEADERLALGTMVAYFVVDLLIVIAVTVVEIGDTGDWSLLTAVLFPVMSVVGVIVLNQRVRHYRRLARIAADKAERRARARRTRREKCEPESELPQEIAPQLLNRADWRELVQGADGFAAELEHICTAPRKEHAHLVNAFLESHGYETKPQSTARDWALDIVELYERGMT